MSIDANARFLFDLEKRIENLEAQLDSCLKLLLAQNEIVQGLVTWQIGTISPSPVNTGDQSTTEPRDSAATKTATPSRGDL